jgi:kinetochore protein Mis12/MTW1
MDADAPTPDSINRLRRKVQETEKLQSALQAEVSQNEALLAQLRPLVSASPPAASSNTDNDTSQPHTHSFSFLTNTPSATTLGVGTQSHANSLVQNTSFIHSQLPSLREIVATLRSHLATLPAKNMAAGVDANTEARHAYIEIQTKRALERVGVDAVVTQDMELGRRMGGEEARALEGIVNAMAAQQERDEDKMEE